jgi:hypothetical protein
LSTSRVLTYIPIREDERPVASISNKRQFELGLINVTRLGTWLLILLNLNKREENSWLQSFAAIILLGALIALYKCRGTARFQSESIAQEMKRNPGVHTNITTYDEKPFTFTTSFNSGYQLKEVTIEVGNNQIFHHVEKLNSILKMTDKSLDLPSRFSTLRKILPHCNVDPVSKGRFLEFFCFPGLLAGDALAYLFNLSSPYSTILSVACSGITWAMSMRESYILNDHELRLHLEGFSFKDSAYCSCPPTCIGMQMKRKILFYPGNSELNYVLESICEGEGTLRTLSEQGLLDSATQEKLDHFEFITRDYRSTLFSPRRMELESDVIRIDTPQIDHQNSPADSKGP